MKGVEAVEVVGDLASQQWGLVTTAQAAACGVDPQSLQRHEDGGRSGACQVVCVWGVIIRGRARSGQGKPQTSG